MAPMPEKVLGTQYKALVIWWDYCTLAVLCPLCSKAEEHELDVRPTEVGWDAPETLEAQCCSSNPRYIVLFPWDVGLGKRKNLLEKRFETVGLNLSDLAERVAEQSSILPIVAIPATTPDQVSRVGGEIQPAQFEVGFPQAKVSDLNPVDQGRRPRRIDQAPEFEEGEILRQPRINLESMKYSSRFSPQITLEELKLLRSERSNTEIKILAQSASVNGVQVQNLPLAVITVNASGRRTVAVLHEGIQSEPIIAISGWAHDWVSESRYLIDCEEWTEEVLKLCRDIDYKLESHNWDKIHGGRYNACHAEKQLVTYFVKRQCLQRQDRSQRMMRVHPEQTPLEAWIALDRDPCEDCLTFKGVIQDIFDVTIHFVDMGRIVGGKAVQECSNPKTPSRKSSRNLKTSIPHRIHRSVTPSTEDRRRTLLITPPKSAPAAAPGNNSRPLQECDDYKSDDGDPLSPCYRRHHRSQAREPDLETPYDDSRHLDVESATLRGRLPKRRRNLITEDTEDEFQNTPSLGPWLEVLTSSPQRSRQLLAPAPAAAASTLRPQRTASCPTAPLAYPQPQARLQSPNNNSRHHHHHHLWSARPAPPAPDDAVRPHERAFPSLGARPGRANAGVGKSPSQILIPIVDLTLDESAGNDDDDDDDDDDGSCFSP